MDWQELVGLDGASLIDWLADDVDDPAEGLWSDWHHNWVASVSNLLASDESLSGVQSDGTHVVSTKMLGDLEDESVLGTLDLESIEDWWEVAFELDIDDGTDDLGHLAVGERPLHDIGHHVLISQVFLNEPVSYTHLRAHET